MSAVAWFLAGLVLGGAIGCVLCSLMVMARGRPLWADDDLEDGQ